MLTRQLFRTGKTSKRPPVIARLHPSPSSLLSGVLLLILLIAGRSHADGTDYFAGLGKVGGGGIPLYLLLLGAGIALFSFFIVLIKPTIGIILAMLLFPFVTQDAKMTIAKLLASVVLLGFFIAWLLGKLT